MTDTLNPFQPAVRTNLKARVALDGPTGAGKTWTALEWATVLADGGKIAVVDTERGSASLYSDKFTFDVLTWEGDYAPGRLADILGQAEAAGYPVVIIDSLSHFWEGEGGTLDMVDAAAQRSGGNQFAGWKVGTPALRHLVDTMLGLDAHVIATMRSKMEYVLEDRGGKKVPVKVGMAPVMRAGIDYEFTLVGDLDLEHRMVISKSRCDLLADQVIQPGRAAEGAQAFMSWLGQGEPLAERATVEALKDRLNALPKEMGARSAFKAEFGHPDHLRESQVLGAAALVERFEAEARDVGAAGTGSSPSSTAAEGTPSPATAAVDVGGGEPASPATAPAAPSGMFVAGEGPDPSGPRESETALTAAVAPEPAPAGSHIEPGGEAAARPVAGDDAHPSPSGPVPLDDLETALIKAVDGARSIPQAKAAVLRHAASKHGHSGTFTDLLADEPTALRVLAELGGTMPEAASTGDPDVTPWKTLDEKAWDTWRKRCNAKAGPGTKAKPHPRLLDEDQAIYDEQRHAIAYQASRRHRGEGHEVTSWADLTERECVMVEEGLDGLADGTAVLTFADTGSPGGWVVEPKVGAA